MSNITYHTGSFIVVKLDGKIVGKIKQVTGGWQYIPKGQKVGGKVWPKIEHVKLDIELDRDEAELGTSFIDTVQRA